MEIELDVVLGNDITTPVAIDELNKHGLTSVYDQKKIVIVPDHFTPNKDIKTAQQCQMVRAFVKDQKLKLFEVGQMGIEHCLLPEQGWLSLEMQLLVLTVIPVHMEPLALFQQG